MQLIKGLSSKSVGVLNIFVIGLVKLMCFEQLGHGLFFCF